MITNPHHLHLLTGKIMYLVRSTEGVDYPLPNRYRYLTLDAMSSDLNLSNDTIIPIPFSCRYLKLIYGNYNRLRVNDSSKLLILMEFLGCNQVVEMIGDRLLELVRIGIRFTVSDRVKMILGVTPRVGPEAVLLRLIEYEYLVDYKIPLEPPVDELTDYVNSTIVNSFADTLIDEAIQSLIFKLKRMGITHYLIVKSLHSVCYSYDVEDVLLRVMVNGQMNSLISESLKSGFFHSIGTPILMEVLYGFNDELIDIVMKSYRIAWLNMLCCSLNSDNPYPLSRLKFLPHNVNSISQLRHPLIVTKNSIAHHVEYLLTVNILRSDLYITFWHVLLRELICSCHHVEARIILAQLEHCRDWLASVPTLSVGESYIASMIRSESFNIESVQLLLEYCPGIMIDYRGLMRINNKNLNLVAQQDSNIHNLILFMRYANKRDRAEIPIVVGLFKACNDAGSLNNVLINSLISNFNYFQAVIPLRIFDFEVVWNYLTLRINNIRNGEKYVKIVYNCSDHSQRRSYFHTDNYTLKNILLSLKIKDCRK